MAKKKFPKSSIRANVVPTSINVEDRTFEVCYGSDTPVLRGWGDRYYEVLSFDSGHVNTQRLDSGRVNFIDSHNTYGASSVWGVVTSHRIEGGKGYATIKFSKRKELDGVWQDIEDGIVCNISVGYNVRTYEHTANADGPDTYRATDWEPMEISAVSVPADHMAGIRSEESEGGQLVDIISLNQNSTSIMNEAQIRAAATAANLPESFVNELLAREGMTDAIAMQEINAAQTRAAANTNPAPAAPAAPAPTPAPVDNTEAIRAAANAAVTAERVRTTGITRAGNAAGMTTEFIQGLIENGSNIDQARAAILAQFEVDGAANNVRGGNTARMSGPNEVDQRRSGMEEGILFRAGVPVMDANGQRQNAPSENARNFSRMSLMDMARSVVDGMGVNSRGMTNIEVLEIATGRRSIGGLHSTSDFPIILGNTINRVLRGAYDLAPRTFMPFTRRVNAVDFRERTSAQLSGMTNGLREVKEGGEYKRATMKEAKESWKIKKYGNILAVTWEMIINDDLSAFNRIPTSMAEDVAQLQSDIIYNILLNNAALSDGVALFHATHKNLGTAAAINITSMSAAKALMRKQTALDGKKFLNLEMAHLLVGPDKELEAAQLLSSVVIPNQNSNVNVHAGAYNLIVEPRITGNKWFLAANVGRVDTIEYGTLEGEEINLSQREGFDVDGVEFKLRSTFGAKAIDHRGLFYNPGA